MHSATTLPASAPAIPVRDQFAPIKVVFLVGINLGAVTAVWHWTWAAVGACILMHAACGGVGICVGYHRLLTRRSFKCPRAVEYGLALLASLSMEALMPLPCNDNVSGFFPPNSKLLAATSSPNIS